MQPSDLVMSRCALQTPRATGSAVMKQVVTNICFELFNEEASRRRKLRRARRRSDGARAHRTVACLTSWPLSSRFRHYVSASYRRKHWRSCVEIFKNPVQRTSGVRPI